MRILIVDNTIEPHSWGSPELRKFSHLAPGATIHVRRAPQGDLCSPIGFDRVILSGSKTSAMEDAPWITSLHGLVQKTLDNNIPFLGVCYGHQTLARVVGGNQVCRTGSAPEIGWTEIEILAESNLMKGLPKKFHTFSSHFQEVATLPPGFKKLARSSICEIQACQLENRPVFGIQFHPERDLISSERTFSDYKKEDPKTPFLNQTQGKKLFSSKVGETIFRNFLGSL